MRNDIPRICIIGAGAAGLAVAYALSLRGINCRICDAGKAGQGALAASAGMIAPGAEVWEARARPNALAGEFAGLARHGASAWPGWAERIARETGLDIGYRPCGSLIPLDDAHAPGTQILGALDALGIEAHRLHGAAAQAHLPGLAAPDGAAFLPGDAQVSAPDLARALPLALAARGIEVNENARVATLERRAQGWRLILASGEVIDTDIAVLAAGWAAAKLHPAAQDVTPVKGQAVMLAGGAASGYGALLRAGEVYVAPKSGGRLLVGASAEPGLSDLTTDPGTARTLLERAARHLPAIAGMDVLAHWAGVRPALPGMMPRAGEAEPGLFVALGAHRHGVMLAPAIGEGLAGLIADGRSEVPLAAFAPDRVNEGLSSGG